MSDASNCGACKYWAHDKKRNVSNPETPVYYADCLYPVADMALPHCVSFEETSAANGINCPCFEAKYAPCDYGANTSGERVENPAENEQAGKGEPTP